MSELRAQVVAEIMKLVRPEPVNIGKPTIEELERILNSDDPGRINLAPDGSATMQPRSSVTVGTVADAILPLVLEACAKVAEAHVDRASNERLAKGQKLRGSHHELIEIHAEERGEDIAAGLIAEAIRALKP